MPRSSQLSLSCIILSLFISFSASSAQTVCEGFGPQTPRDIDNKAGTNKRDFSIAPAYQKLNLCNIHMHNPAEHKAAEFSIKKAGGGYQCNIGESLSKKELKPMSNKNYCKDVNPGDTIEVHWVHTSCDIKPGKGLGSCLSEKCTNPNLRVETQVFTVVNDPQAMNFMDFAYQGNRVDGLHQAKAIPTNTGKAVEFTGSTTGPSFTEQSCSNFQVTWNVRPQCAKVDIKSLSQWCKHNVFEEHHAHGVRQLVTSKALLSEIQ